MKHGSLFSGIGGFDLAAEWMGWENIFHCEWNSFGQKVLKHYWPNAISYNDITKTDFTIHRGAIDILTGGFPCQPYSNAGKRLGKEDERHLWPEMLRAIREIQPSYVVGENVRGLTNWNGGMVFDEVQSDLEAQGYEVLPFLLPACAVNAPHRRDRIWFVAKSGNIGCNNRSDNRKERHLQTNEGIATKDKSERSRWVSGISKISSNATNAGGEQLQEWSPESIAQDRKENKSGMDDRAKRSGNIRNATDTDNKLRKRRSDTIRSKKTERHVSPPFCREGWQNFQTESPLCNGNDGLSGRLDGVTFSKWRQESIKAGGNAIVPQVALQIFKAIEETDIEI